MKEPEAEWRQELRGTVLILRTDADQESYAAKMLRYNRLEGMPRVHVGYIDGKEEFRYDVSGLITLREWMKEETLTGALVRRWLGELLDLFRTGEGYLLAEEDFLCSEDYLFLTPDLSLRACYLEGYGEPVAEQLRALVGSFLEKVRYEKEEDVRLVYDLYQCCTDHCSERALREILLREQAEPETKEEAPEPEAAEETPEEKIAGGPKPGKKELLIFGAGVLAAALLLYFGGQFFTEEGEFRWLRTSAFLAVCGVTGALLFREEIRERFRRKKEEEDFDWGWTEGDEDLSATQPIPELAAEAGLTPAEKEDPEVCLLLEAEDGEETALRELPCAVGSLYANDFVIPERTVSRRHARFVREKGEIRLEDLESLNGTRVNGKKLRPGTPVKLREGDVIEIARHRWIVHLPPGPNA